MSQVFSFFNSELGKLYQFIPGQSKTTKYLLVVHQCEFVTHTLTQHPNNLFMVIWHKESRHYKFCQGY